MNSKYTFNDLLNIMDKLRSPEGCPWDREQTHDSLKRYLIEETYEVLEAIDLKDTGKITEELGDILLQVVFHCQVGKENGTFDINDVTDRICRKMISRHPHVFGEVKADTSEEVLTNWEKIKKNEKGIESQTDVLKDVPSNLPALMRAYKVQQKAAQVGFDWDDIEDVYKKVEEELQEVREAISSGSTSKKEEEIGDLLFAVVNLSRFAKAHPEMSLTATTEKFIRRFSFVEAEANKAGRNLNDMTLEEMDKLWDLAKKGEK